MSLPNKSQGILERFNCFPDNPWSGSFARKTSKVFPRQHMIRPSGMRQKLPETTHDQAFRNASKVSPRQHMIRAFRKASKFPQNSWWRLWGGVYPPPPSSQLPQEVEAFQNESIWQWQIEAFSERNKFAANNSRPCGVRPLCPSKSRPLRTQLYPSN